MSEKVLSIVGSGNPTPKELPAGEVWNCNTRPRTRYIEKHITRTFQIHPIETWVKSEVEWVERYKAGPIYILDQKTLDKIHAKKLIKAHDISSAQFHIYPVYLIYLIYPVDPFQLYYRRKDTSPQLPCCSSFDFMMALAIAERFTEVNLFGITYQVGTMRERLMEHVSLAYWIGNARGRGMTVNIFGKHLLYFPYHYGYDYWKERKFGQQLGLSALHEARLDDGQAKPNKKIKGVAFTGYVEEKYN